MGIDQANLMALARPVDAHKPFNLFHHAQAPSRVTHTRAAATSVNPCTGARSATSHGTSVTADLPGCRSAPGAQNTGILGQLQASRPGRPVYNADWLIAALKDTGIRSFGPPNLDKALQPPSAFPVAYSSERLTNRSTASVAACWMTFAGDRRECCPCSDLVASSWSLVMTAADQFFASRIKAVPRAALPGEPPAPRPLFRVGRLEGEQALENVHVKSGQHRRLRRRKVRGRQPDGRSRGTDPPGRDRPGPVARAGNRRSRENPDCRAA